MRPTKELDRNSRNLKQPLKKTFKPNKKKSKYGRKTVLTKLLTLFHYRSNNMEKLMAALTFFDYWSNQMEKVIAVFKIFLLTRLI